MTTAIRSAAGVGVPARWRTKVVSARTGGADARLLCVGDSVTAGARGAGTTNAVDSYPARLAGLLNADSPAAPGIIFGGPMSIVNDPRVIPGNLWVTTNGLPAYDRGWKGQVGGGDLSITFTETFDTIIVHHLAGPSVGGISTINVDGGASLGNIPGTSPFLVKLSTTFTCAPGTHTINIASPTGAQLWIVGIEVALSSQRRVLVSNAGRPGTQTAHWIGTAAGVGVQQTIQLAAPDLTIINLTINDATVPASVATVTANLITLLGYVRAAGSDVLFVVPHWCNGANFDTWQPQYADAIKGVAASHGHPVYDQRSRPGWSSYAAALSNGFMVDNAHCTPAGYADEAAGIYNMIAVR